MRMVLRLSETDWLPGTEVAAGRLTGTNAGGAGVLSARCVSLIQRRTMLALRPLSSEIREIYSGPRFQDKGLSCTLS